MDSLIGTYEDEWKRAVQDPDLRKQFRQFVNTVSVARGFDSILDLDAFAGGLFSFWNREGFRLTGSGVLLTTPGSLIPSMRASKDEGQANFVNPGIFWQTPAWNSTSRRS